MREYVVRKGDTLHRVAAAFAVSVESLMVHNPWASEQPYLIPGQVLHICPVMERTYIIQPGEDIRSVAVKLGVQERDLLRYNQSLIPPQFTAGRIIKLPEPSYKPIVHLRGEYGYEDAQKDINELQQRYPFLEIGSIGTSVLGKDIPYIRIGHGPRNIHANASVHANEWLTTPCLLRFVERYAEAAAFSHEFHRSDPQEWLNLTSLWVVPMLNPDGVELVLQGISPTNPMYSDLKRWNEGRSDFRGWKANIRGVDLNDQFPAYWEEEAQRRGKTGPSRRDYGGPAPLSEPEARSLADWTETIGFDMVLSIHSQGQEIYWNYRDLEPKESREWASKLSSASGYRAVKLGGSDAGYKDWFIQRFGKPGFTIEAGLGVNPLPMSGYSDMCIDIELLMAAVLSG